MNNDNIGIGIIGLGFMGTLHARAFTQLDGCNVVAVADPFLDKCPHIPEAKIQPDFHKDFTNLLSRNDIDAVVIASPEDKHKEITIHATDYKKHILLEKPIATTLEDAEAIIHASKKAGIKLVMAHILRYDVRYAQIKSAVYEGVVGKPLVCYARRNAPITEARRLKGRVEVEDYISVHDIDQIFWYFEDDVVSVYSEIVEGPVKKELGVHDFIWIMMRLKNGGLGIVETGWGLSEGFSRWKKPVSWGGFGDVCLELIGEKGSLYLDYRPMCISGVDKEGWRFPDTVHWPLLHGEIIGDVLEEDRYFLKVLRDEKQIISTGEDGLKALKVVIAAKKSYTEGRPIQIS